MLQCADQIKIPEGSQLDFALATSQGLSYNYIKQGPHSAKPISLMHI